MICSRYFIIPNSDFILEEMTCSQDFIIPNSDFSLLSSSVRSASSRGFIIHNSDFTLPSSSCEYPHVCCDGRSRVAVPVSAINEKER